MSDKGKGNVSILLHSYCSLHSVHCTAQ